MAIFLLAPLDEQGVVGRFLRQRRLFCFLLFAEK